MVESGDQTNSDLFSLVWCLLPFLDFFLFSKKLLLFFLMMWLVFMSDTIAVIFYSLFSIGIKPFYWQKII